MTRFNDPLKDIQKSIAAMTSISDPLKDYRDSIASTTAFADPLKDYRDSIASMAVLTDPLKDYRDFIASMAALTDPLKNYRDSIASMAALTDPLKDYRDSIASMAALTDPLKDYRDSIASMASLADPLKNYRDSIVGFTTPLNGYKDLLVSMTANIENSSSLGYLKKVALEVNSDLTIDSNGCISLSTKQIAAADLQALSSQLIQNASQNNSSSLEDAINNLTREIQNQNDPLNQRILIWFVYPLIVALLVSFINPVTDNYVKTYLNGNKRVLAKELKLNAQAAIKDSEVLDVLRYVSADILNVRADASKKSDLVGTLRFSSTVLIIKKQKSWTLIEWRDPDNEANIKGWVFSRHLAKFR